MIIHHPWKFFLGIPGTTIGLPLTGFGIAMVMAFMIAQYASETEMERRGFDSKPFADVTLGAVIGGLLGAKIYYAILHHESPFARDGFVFWGGLLGGIVGTAIVIRHHKLGFNCTSDYVAPGLAAAYAVGRTGCWAVGDDYGGPYNGLFATMFPQGAPPSSAGTLTAWGAHLPAGTPSNTIISVYPTQLIEVTLAIVMFFILWRLRDHKHAQGWLFGFYCVLAGAERFIVEFFRAKDDRFIGGFTMAQAIAVAFVAFGVVWMQLRRTTGPDRPGIYSPTAGAA